MNEAPGFASASLGRSLTISGVVAGVTLLGIPLSVASPGSTASEFLSSIWTLSLIPVALGLHGLVRGGANTPSLVALSVGLAGMIFGAGALLAVVVGRATSLGIGPVSVVAFALIGVWLVVMSRLCVSARIVPASVGWVGMAAGFGNVAALVLVLIGGFPTTTDLSDMSAFSPLTIVGGIFSLLSIPLYAAWAIWAARRLPRPA
ncbi:MAG: hypothetical protein M3O80_05465 [Chloroflexota bacterium]|nr:hypothetical protein [Chloroflexota bacterium]